MVNGVHYPTKRKPYMLGIVGSDEKCRDRLVAVLKARHNYVLLIEAEREYPDAPRRPMHAEFPHNPMVRNGPFVLHATDIDRRTLVRTHGGLLIAVRPENALPESFDGFDPDAEFVVTPDIGERVNIMIEQLSRA